MFLSSPSSILPLIPLLAFCSYRAFTPEQPCVEIGGLDPIIRSLRESVILPLNHPALFTSASGLLGAPKGVLLYGPPGCGKTMLAKALAKESGATFINMHVSTLTDKWFGESNKLVAALFSLAHKMQPAIIFIDEIDSFLRERRSNDHEITSMMKAEFMSMWDGLTTGEDTRIIVLGATNRPNDIDSAILRRMPKRFAIKLPSEEQRMNILKLVGVLTLVHVLAKMVHWVDDHTDPVSITFVYVSRCLLRPSWRMVLTSVHWCARLQDFLDLISRRRAGMRPCCLFASIFVARDLTPRELWTMLCWTVKKCVRSASPTFSSTRLTRNHRRMSFSSRILSIKKINPFPRKERLYHITRHIHS